MGLPTFNELAFESLSFFIENEDKLESQIHEKIIKLINYGRADIDSEVLNYKGMYLKISKNNYGTLFINLSRVACGSRFQILAEIVIDKNLDKVGLREENILAEVENLVMSILEKVKLPETT